MNFVDFDQISLDLALELEGTFDNDLFTKSQRIARAQVTINHSLVQMVPKVAELVTEFPRCEAIVGSELQKTRRRQAAFRGRTFDDKCHTVASHRLEGHNYCLRHTQHHLLKLVLERQPK